MPGGEGVARDYLETKRHEPAADQVRTEEDCGRSLAVRMEKLGSFERQDTRQAECGETEPGECQLLAGCPSQRKRTQADAREK